MGKWDRDGCWWELICYVSPELQKSDQKLGPSMNSYCPLIAGGCFSLVIMFQACIHDMKFESFTTSMTTKANFIGCYKCGDEQIIVQQHPWVDGIRLNMTIQGPQKTEDLVRLADRADRHCPSSEIMKRDFPVEVDKFVFKTNDDTTTNWEEVPVYYDMDKYKQIAEQKDHYINQQADMVWHCQNENKENPDSLMTFTFPNDTNSKIVLSHDKPFSSGKYANPVQACFFGGLSSFMHTVATRLYVRGYKVQKIDGTIKSVMNKRKVFAVEKNSYVFPEGATIEIEVVTNAPKSVVFDVQNEAEDMSPTMYNWKNELPLEYAIYRKKPSGKKYGSGGPNPVKINDDESLSQGGKPIFEFDLKESGVRKGGMPISKFMKRFFGVTLGNKSKRSSDQQSASGFSISSKSSDDSF